MFQEVITYITQYGYLSIFLLVFLQEVGVPNPIPNELVLVFAGVLSYSGLLNFGLIISSAFVADILSSTILYVVFYKYGSIIFEKKPSWIPISQKKIDSLSKKINEKGLWAVFIGRISPFIRGYVSVLSGFLKIKPKHYILIQASSAFVWALGYLLAGYLMAYYGYSVQKNIENIKSLFWQIPLIVVVLVGCYFLVKNVAINKK